jgi:serine/threonine-protein kinase
VASGGFGSVYFGLDFATNEPVAIKLLHPHDAHDARVVERFRREAALVHDLDHPNVSPW